MRSRTAKEEEEEEEEKRRCCKIVPRREKGKEEGSARPLLHFGPSKDAKYYLLSPNYTVFLGLLRHYVSAKNVLSL